MWHQLLSGLPEATGANAASELYREIVAHFTAAMEALGDDPLFDDEGLPSSCHLAMNEAAAAMRKLQDALGFPPARLVKSPSCCLG